MKKTRETFIPTEYFDKPPALMARKPNNRVSKAAIPGADLVRVQRMGSRAGKKYVAKCLPTGRIYRTADELVAAECSPEVQAGYARLRSEDEGTPTEKLCNSPEAARPTGEKGTDSK